MKTQTSARKLEQTMGEPDADALIAMSIKRGEQKKARVEIARKRKVTPAHKRMHAVDNEHVHTRNESARQVDARSEIDRDSEQANAWTRPSNLDAPPPRPGFVHRWKRYRLAGSEDGDNLENAIAEGWSPVKAAKVKRGHELTANLNGKYGQYIVKKGLILCEMPEKIFLQKRKFYRMAQRRMTEAIDRNLFKVNHSAMPMMAPMRQTRVTQSARRGRLEDSIPGDDE